MSDAEIIVSSRDANYMTPGAAPIERVSVLTT